jgi:hypothetical protein
MKKGVGLVACGRSLAAALLMGGRALATWHDPPILAFGLGARNPATVRQVEY